MFKSNPTPSPFQYADELIMALEPLDQNGRSALIQSLGEQVLTLIQNGNELAKILKRLDKDTGKALIKTLGTQLKTIVQNQFQLESILKRLDQKAWPVFFEGIGDTFNIIIPDSEGLAYVLKKIEPQNWSWFFETLSSVVSIQTIIKNNDKLVQLLLSINDMTTRPTLIKILNTHLQSIVQNSEQLFSLLKTLLEQESRLDVIRILGTHLQTIIEDDRQLTALLKQFAGNDVAQLTCLVLLDKKELVDRLNPKSTAMTIYADYYRFAKGKEPLQASRDILENYVQPELLGVFKLAVRDTICLKAVRETLNDKTISSIDALLTRITREIPLAKIKECDTSLYQRLHYVCALANESLDKYVATVQPIQKVRLQKG